MGISKNITMADRLYGEHLKTRRKALGLSLKAVQEAIKIPQTTLFNYEYGYTRCPVGRREKLTDYYDRVAEQRELSIDQAFEGEWLRRNAMAVREELKEEIELAVGNLVEHLMAIIADYKRLAKDTKEAADDKR